MKETFAEMIARARAERKTAEAIVRQAIARKLPRLRYESQDCPPDQWRGILLSAGFQDCAYRITDFDVRGPMGHRDYRAHEIDAMAAEIASAIRSGMVQTRI